MLNAPSRKVFKVYELTKEIRSILENQFSDLWIEGEISDLRNPRSGHLYFTLKDNTATLKTVIFKSHLRFLRFIPKAGEQVLIRGHLSLYEPRGEYQLICDYIEPKGAGAMQAAFESLKKKLQKEGLFDPGKKKPLPLLPMQIGVITSPSGAAIQDIMKVVDKSDFPCQLLLFPVSVQGGGASAEIANALDEINHGNEKGDFSIDVVLLARGGGSLEDLWAFNEAAVAYAISRSTIPVISAIGHESDTTIADYAADIQASTPSFGANIIVQHGMSTTEWVHQYQEKLISLIQKQLEDQRNQLAMSFKLLSDPTPRISSYKEQIDQFNIRLNQSILRKLEGYKNLIWKAQQGLSHLSPVHRLSEFRRQFNHTASRLEAQGHQLIEQNKNRLENTLNQLDLVSPLNILNRGYSITRKIPSLEVIRESDEVSVGDRLQIKLHKGTLICLTERKNQSLKNGTG